MLHEYLKYSTGFQHDMKLYGYVNFHEEVLTGINFPLPGSQQTRTIFKQIQDIIRTNVLTMCHEDWTIHMTFRVLKFFQQTGTIFEDKNVASRVKNNLPPGGHVFQLTGTIFNLVQDIIGANPLTMFHEHQTINVASRVLTTHLTKNVPPLGANYHDDRTINPPCFSTNQNYFDLIQDIIETNLLTKFHDDGKIDMASRMLTREKRLAFWRLYIIETNLLTTFHENRIINVASRVLTKFYFSHIKQYKVKSRALSTHVFQPTWNQFLDY
ncbi:hypothetical protein DPMN_164772 [Dreissena polymorpha]|uniref:Uncharacterized protein n=1 Tax=Dreissena polymorpha TaxID=45954 RepID=A0A9D4IVR3_DREPO|nr:hypothetical protein DPMN_164772 [Dreissena polymorpha]